MMCSTYTSRRIAQAEDDQAPGDIRRTSFRNSLFFV